MAEEKNIADQELENVNGGATSFTLYTVANGDTWESVALKFGISAYVLKANNYPCSSPLYAGRRITVPVK